MASLTIRDVAAEAGVSKSAVSDILNGDRRDLYRPDTVARVLETAERLGYHTHAGARMMRQQKRNVVGIATRTELLGWHTVSSMVVATHRALTANGFQSLLVDPEQMVPNKSYTPFPSPDLLAGIISADLTMEEQVPNFYKVLAARLPIVALYPVNSADVDSVTTDRARAVEIAVGHLVQLGHRRIAFTEVFDSDKRNALDKIEGWKRACRTYRLKPDPEWIIRQSMLDSTAIRGEQIANAITSAKSKPTAVIASSDEIALYTIQHLRQLGWKSPRDLSIVGFDGAPYGEMAGLPLTTVEQPMNEIATAAVARLTQLIEFHEKGQAWKPIHRRVEPILQVRESTVAVEDNS